jgi:hypothetical protein
MKRFLMLVGVGVVAGAMYVAAAPGSRQSAAPTAKQFASLKKQVASLNKTVKTLAKDEKSVKTLAVDEAVLLVACMKTAVPVGQFGDDTNHTQGYRYATSANLATPGSDVLGGALDVTASTDPNAVFFVGGDTDCATALASSSASTTSFRHEAALAGVRLPSAMSRPAFAAHRP